MEDDGIQIEPFNLRQEREEGYFDANGNFVEYAKENEIKVTAHDLLISSFTFTFSGTPSFILQTLFAALI